MGRQTSRWARASSYTRFGGYRDPFSMFGTFFGRHLLQHRTTHAHENEEGRAAKSTQATEKPKAGSEVRYAADESRVESFWRLGPTILLQRYRLRIACHAQL